jgi:hypothetical protein
MISSGIDWAATFRSQHRAHTEGGAGIVESPFNLMNNLSIVHQHHATVCSDSGTPLWQVLQKYRITYDHERRRHGFPCNHALGHSVVQQLPDGGIHSRACIEKVWPMEAAAREPTPACRPEQTEIEGCDAPVE